MSGGAYEVLGRGTPGRGCSWQYDGAQQPREGLRGRGGERRRLSWRGEAAQATGTRQRPAKHSASRRTPDGKTSRQISPSASLCREREREQLLIW